MKLEKRIFTFLIILTCLFSCLITCTPFESEEVEYEYTDVVYSQDGNSVTIYLDGQVPVPRTLTREIALMGCDYFEVTFLYQLAATPTGTEVVRSSWMAGKSAGIIGLRRNTPINYGNTNRQPGQGSGSAILFAGKSDKTLMAIGKLSAVDGNTATPLNITANTKSVTFTLAPITAAVSNTSSSSFVTAARTAPYNSASFANTLVSLKSVFATLPAKQFPFFDLVQGEDIKAKYTFDLYTGAVPNANYAFSAYSGGIFISNPADFGAIIPGIPLPVGYIIEKKIPRYTSYSAVGQPLDTYHQSILMLDEKTIVTLDNNNTADAEFNPEVAFTFNTAGTINGTVFSLVFSIPVYALREFDENGNRSRWYIRSSYGPNLYDLDDGTRGMGGAVLIGTGTPERTSRDYTIRIKELPNKWQYSGSTTSARALNINGLVVELITTDDVPVVIGNINYNDLSFRIDRYSKNAEWTANSSPGYEYTVPGSAPRVPYSFPPEFYGIIEVIVEYHDSAAQKTYSASFLVLITNSTAGAPATVPGANFNNISTDNIVHLYDWTYTSTAAGKPLQGAKAEWDTFRGKSSATISSYNNAAEKFRNALDNIVANTTTIFIVHHSFTFFDGGNPNINLGEGIPGMFMIIAADDDGDPNNNNNNQIILGRRGTPPYLARITHQLSGTGLNGYYFGAWPFKTPPNGITTTNFPAVTKTFTVDCRGVGVTNPIPTTFKVLIDNSTSAPSDVGPGGGIYNVRVGDGMNIIPTTTTTIIENGKTIDVKSYPLLH